MYQMHMKRESHCPTYIEKEYKRSEKGTLQNRLLRRVLLFLSKESTGNVGGGSR